ncbi:MAG: D-galactonate dehydratase family protein [Actinobacteria bacterium]|nr:D-galactonate dehydratase family protein [Actinomycetota bacterium]MCL5447405.1 D-galactonate dehydratase family protein [Actinomycetota bacterium]
MVEKIASGEVVVASPGRNFVTLRLRTESGITGLGDATLNGRELAVASYLRDHVVPALNGRDAQAIEDTWMYLYKGAYWRGGPVTMAAIAAVDMALWDIKAKMAGLPLYQLLGGACRERVLAYAHTTGSDINGLMRSIEKAQEDGYEAFRVQIGIPGIMDTYGVSASEYYEPALRDSQPARFHWDAETYLRQIPKLLRDIRAQCGEEAILLHDVHHRLAPVQAARLARDLEEVRLFWLEDVTPSDDQDALSLVRQHSTTPLAIGEVFNTIWQCKALMEGHLIDYIRMSVTHGGGVTHLRKVLWLAELHQVKSGLHGPSDVSPVGMAASLHLDFAISNFGIQEYQQRPALIDDLFPHAYSFRDGYLYPGEESGLGVTLSDALTAEKYPYVHGYLPVNYLMDGTVHEW